MKNAALKAYSYLRRLVKREFNYHLVKPTDLLLFLTYRCTSRCKTCVMWQRRTRQDELSLSEYKNIIDMAGNNGIENVELFGGDALLRKDILIPLITYIKKSGIPRIYLATNCNLLDEDTAKALVDAGIDVFFVSLDAIGELHDYIRGVPGTFDRARRGLEYLIKAKKGRQCPKVIVNTTVSSLNIDEFEKIVPFAREIGADEAAFEYIGEFHPRAIAQSKIDGIKPQPYFIPQGQSLLLNREQARLLKKKLKEIKSGAENLKIGLYTRNIDVLTVEDLSNGLFPHRRCYVCRYLISVDPFGNVIPCLFFNNYDLGNIRRERISKIWNNAKHRRFIKHVDGNRIAICKHCALSAERNPDFLQDIKKGYFILAKKGMDEAWN